MDGKYYVVHPQTSTVIRAQKWLPESCMYGETIDTGWSDITLANIHRARIWRDCKLDGLEVMQLSDFKVAEYDRMHAEMVEECSR